jgi:flagellar hook-associated protein 3 FlgL
MASIDQYVSNIDSALSWNKTAETAYTSATDLLQRAKELAVKGANGNYPASDMIIIGKEVDQILADMVSLGNAQYDGRYIFAGTQTTTKPFTYVPEVAGPPIVPASVTYNGNSGTMSYEIEKGVTIPVNIPGNIAFKGSADPANDSAYKVLIDLRDHLNLGDHAAVSNDTSQIDLAMNNMSDAVTSIGASVNRLELVRDRQDQEQLNLKSMLSDLEDVDFADIVTRIKNEETAYQAALTAGSMSIQTSLMDFLK